MKYQAIDINTHILSVNLLLYLLHDNVFLQSQSDHHPIEIHKHPPLLKWDFSCSFWKIFVTVVFQNGILTLSNNFLYPWSLASMGTTAKLLSLNNKVPTPLRWRSVINCSVNLDEFSDLMAAISLCGNLSSPSKTFSFASITSFVAGRKNSCIFCYYYFFLWRHQ